MLCKSFVFAVGVAVFSILLVTSANAQQFSEEVRPFDFNNDYYKINGIYAGTLLDRKNGVDGRSVFDVPADNSKFASVRITETMPAYAADGGPIFWNYYATATKESFLPDESGAIAINAAKAYPVYVFPSTFVRGATRQSALIPIDENYFQKNPIGIAKVVIVEFNSNISRGGQKILNMLAASNGTSIDGTPIIRTSAELGSLVTEGLVTLRGDDNMPYAVAKVIQHPDRGGITSDAFLVYVSQADGQPLASEMHFVTRFECLKNAACLSGTMTTKR
jgi:hypothetical protein